MVRDGVQCGPVVHGRSPVRRRAARDPRSAGRTDAADTRRVNVCQWQQVLVRPQYTDADAEFNLLDVAWDLIGHFIAEPAHRWSSASVIKAHPMFAGCEWDNMRQAAAPPFVPRLKDEADTSYFDDFTDPSNALLYANMQRRSAAGATAAATVRPALADPRPARRASTDDRPAAAGRAEHRRRRTRRRAARLDRLDFSRCPQRRCRRR